MTQLSVGQDVELEVDKLALGGRGLARIQGIVVFTPYALPGQRIRARITKVKKRHAEAQILDVLHASEHEVTPPCPHFGICGGCLWQHLDYAEQLKWKQRFVQDSIERTAQIDDISVFPTLPSPEVYRYRNKMEFAFAGDLTESDMVLGMRSFQSSDVSPTPHCRLLPQPAVDVVNAVAEWCAESGAPPYDADSRVGFWRFLVVRMFGDDIMLQFITTKAPPLDETVAAIADRIVNSFPRVLGVTHSIRNHPAQIAYGERIRQEFGKNKIHAELGRTRYALSVESFFQTNTGAAEQLYSLVQELAAPKAGDAVWDVYCGSGGVGLYIAEQNGVLTGFDISRKAVEDARANAKSLGLHKARFYSGDVRKTLRNAKGAPDILITDPPRAGMHQDVIQEILDRAPGAVISIGCDPMTQARDIRRLSTKYALCSVHPVDLFPQTPHVESVALLARK